MIWKEGVLWSWLTSWKIIKNQEDKTWAQGCMPTHWWDTTSKDIASPSKCERGSFKLLLQGCILQISFSWRCIRIEENTVPRAIKSMAFSGYKLHSIIWALEAVSRGSQHLCLCSGSQGILHQFTSEDSKSLVSRTKGYSNSGKCWYFLERLHVTFTSA